MSQQNVELSKRLSAAGRRGDIEAATEFLAEDVVATEVGGSLDTPRVFDGRNALLGYYTQRAEPSASR